MTSTADFERDFMQLAAGGVNPNFVVPLPAIQGLARTASYVLQSESRDTVSCQLASSWQSYSLGVKLVEVYNNTVNRATGSIHRNAGMLNLYKRGYPVLTLDATVRNVSSPGGQRVPFFTGMYVTFPLATPEQQALCLDAIAEAAGEKGFPPVKKEVAGLPAYFGPALHCTCAGIHLEMIRLFRDAGWEAYHKAMETTPPRQIDYSPLQEFGRVEIARLEHRLYELQGFDVPVEMCGGVLGIMNSFD
jgi:hypothetical protein